MGALEGLVAPTDPEVPAVCPSVVPEALVVQADHPSGEQCLPGEAREAQAGPVVLGDLVDQDLGLQVDLCRHGCRQVIILCIIQINHS